MSTVFLGGLACLAVGLAAGFIFGVMFGAALYCNANHRAEKNLSVQLRPLIDTNQEISANLRVALSELGANWEPTEIDDDNEGRFS